VLNHQTYHLYWNSTELFDSRIYIYGIYRYEEKNHYTFGTKKSLLIDDVVVTIITIYINHQ